MHELALSWESLGSSCRGYPPLWRRSIKCESRFSIHDITHQVFALELLGQWKTKYECPKDDGSTEHESSEDEGSE